MIVIPKDLEVHTKEDDELNKNRFKLTLVFSLPRGSYATVLLKAIFRK